MCDSLHILDVENRYLIFFRNIEGHIAAHYTVTTYKELYWADRYVSDDCIAYYRFPSAPVVTRVPVSIGAMGVGGQVTTFFGKSCSYILSKWKSESQNSNEFKHPWLQSPNGVLGDT